MKVFAPFMLLEVILPFMIGPGYRTWALDVGVAWWNKREWLFTFFSQLFFWN
jgi:hypothetical protein